MRSTIRVSEEEITPERAAEMLTKVFNVRRTRADHVGVLARAMRDGTWELNGATIKLDHAGYVIDGEHRLRACVQAERPFRTLVAYGIERSSTIDTGMRARTLGQLVAADGYQRASIISSIARLALMLEVHGDLERVAWQSIKAGLTVQLIKAYVDEHGEALQAAATLAGQPAHVTGLPSGAIGLVAYTASTHPKLVGFLSGLTTGEGLRKGNPVYALRERALNAGVRHRMRFADGCACVFKCWNAYARNETMQVLRWTGQKEKIQAPIA